jgi:amino acid transporter
MNTGARVTYAMGKDDEAPEHFGMLHSKTLTPHRAVRTLSFITAFIGIIAVSLYFGDGSALTDSAIAALPHGIFSNVGFLTHDKLAALPNSMLMITLTSNFGTFILYALSCMLCFIAYKGRADRSVVKHVLIPLFGLAANIGCMMFYIIGPFLGIGTKMEPLGALVIAALWGAYGAFYFVKSSKAKGKGLLLENRAANMPDNQSA